MHMHVMTEQKQQQQHMHVLPADNSDRKKQGKKSKEYIKIQKKKTRKKKIFSLAVGIHFMKRH